MVEGPLKKPATFYTGASLAKNRHYGHHSIPTERFNEKRIESNQNLSVKACYHS
jgi:hypothetical protein